MSHVSGERFRSFSLGILRMRHPICKIPGQKVHGDWENEGGSYDPFIGDPYEATRAFWRVQRLMARLPFGIRAIIE